MNLELTNSPSPDAVRIIRRGLSAFNVAKVPELLDLPDEDYLVILYEDNEIVGGAICEFDWGWLYTDTLWVDENKRGKGYGKIIMESAETYAVKCGVNHSYLSTSSFQAKPLYESVNYSVFAEIENRPKRHTWYWLEKRNLQVKNLDPRIKIISPQDKAIHAFLEKGLLDHAAKFEPVESVELAVILRDEDSLIKGGIFGSTFWDFFDLRFFWLDDSLRGQGWGKKILQMAEDECRKRACLGITCDTSSFQSLPFYQSQGFEIMGTLKERPPQYESYFLQKKL